MTTKGLRPDFPTSITKCFRSLSIPRHETDETSNPSIGPGYPAGRVASCVLLEDRARMHFATVFAVIGLLVGCSAVPREAGSVPPVELVRGAAFSGEAIAPAPDTS